MFYVLGGFYIVGLNQSYIESSTVALFDDYEIPRLPELVVATGRQQG